MKTHNSYFCSAGHLKHHGVDSKKVFVTINKSFIAAKYVRQTTFSIKKILGNKELLKYLQFETHIVVRAKHFWVQVHNHFVKDTSIDIS